MPVGQAAIAYVIRKEGGDIHRPRICLSKSIPLCYGIGLGSF
jgi:hypothetical protein